MFKRLLEAIVVLLVFGVEYTILTNLKIIYDFEE